MGVRCGRSAAPVFRLVRFCGPPPEPEVPVRERPAREVFMPLLCLGSSMVSGYGASVAVADDGDLFGADHLDVFRARASLPCSRAEVDSVGRRADRAVSRCCCTCPAGKATAEHVYPGPPLVPRLGSVLVRS